MSEHVQKTIADLQEKLRIQEAQVSDTKRLINLLCKETGLAPLYADVDGTHDSISNIRSDQFYGRPLATVIKEYLKMRKSANLGAATVREIHESLVRGGYKFDTKNDENSKRGLQISLSKNSLFHRIPSGAWGLSEWYPSAKMSKPGSKPEQLETPDDQEAGKDGGDAHE